MTNQSILLVIRRMWEYFTVPNQGDIGFAPEEHDPVGEFLEQQRGGAGLIEPATETIPEPETESSQATADISPPSAEILETEPTDGPSESESEVLPPTADSSQSEAEEEVIQEMTDNETSQAENEVLPQPDDVAPDEAEDKAAEEAAEDGKQEEGDDLLDIFRDEKEVKETDAIHESLTDVDIQELLEDSKDLLAEINSRRYRRS